MISTELINDFSCCPLQLKILNCALVLYNGDKLIGTAELVNGPNRRVQYILTLTVLQGIKLESYIQQMSQYIPRLKIIVKRDMTYRKLRELDERYLRFRPVSR